MKEKKCSKCGALFGCNATGTGCWCEQYDLSTDTLKQLKNDYDDCLCENCLKLYEAEKSTTDSKE